LPELQQSLKGTDTGRRPVICDDQVEVRRRYKYERMPRGLVRKSRTLADKRKTGENSKIYVTFYRLEENLFSGIGHQLEERLMKNKTRPWPGFIRT
jgi:hypothetical protein